MVPRAAVLLWADGLPGEAGQPAYPELARLTVTVTSRAELELLLLRVRAAEHLHLLEVVEVPAHVRTVVVLGLADAGVLDGDVTLLAELHRLGVRVLAPIHGHGNAAGSGALDRVDAGLTEHGQVLLAELNAVGMVVDAAGASERATVQMCELTRAPLLISHCVLDADCAVPGAITVGQARACAATGGVIGIGTPATAATVGAEDFLALLERAVALVGAEHVGLGAVAPEVLRGLDGTLRARGWSASDAAAVIGGNAVRVARQVLGRG
ncbi:membrane dipeptidase [Rhodococcus sp. X156]|uniref:dipeptidase n=1 Tax=Rhodococcus sp. X156 TaxID=2499145 RepID=UPI0013E33955|nr:membrane dipeptidase [Rhodococcus sp. X156]